MTEDTIEREISPENTIDTLTCNDAGLERMNEDHELLNIYFKLNKSDENIIWYNREDLTKYERQCSLASL